MKKVLKRAWLVVFAVGSWAFLTAMFLLAAPFNAFEVVMAGFDPEKSPNIDHENRPSAEILYGRWAGRDHRESCNNHQGKV